MAEYYERETLIDALMMYTWRDEDDREIDDSDEKRAWIEGWFPNVPVADVKPVVRCKFCRSQRWCKFAQYLGNDGFCSQGEYATNCGALMDDKGGDGDV